MRKSLSVLLVASMTLGACAVVQTSVLNPGNWFGRSTSAAVSPANAAPSNPLIPTRSNIFRRDPALDLYAGKPLDEIVDLTVEREGGGALVRVTGRAARQGIYAVQLTPATPDEVPVDGVLTFRLEGVEPSRATNVGGPATREVTAARKITEQQLRGVRTIRVEGLRNALVVRR